MMIEDYYRIEKTDVSYRYVNKCSDYDYVQDSTQGIICSIGNTCLLRLIDALETDNAKLY